MEKKAIYFLETKGIKYYKCDTFWSQSKDYKDAKIHDNSEHDQQRFFTSLCSGLKLTDGNKSVNESIYGFQTIEQDFTGYRVPDDVKLSDPIYLKVISSVDKSGVNSYDYKVVIRNEKINTIIK